MAPDAARVRLQHRLREVFNVQCRSKRRGQATRDDRRLHGVPGHPVAAVLGLADLLATGRMSAKALAKATGTHDRSLRAFYGPSRPAASSKNRSREVSTHRLRRIAANGCSGVVARSRAWFQGGETSGGRGATCFTRCAPARTPSSTYSAWAHFEQRFLHPDRAASFDTYMADQTRARPRPSWRPTISPHIVASWMSAAERRLLGVILAAVPQRKEPFSTPRPEPRAPCAGWSNWRRRRCRVVAGDFFASVPDGADAYILKSVLHDWEDDRALAILENSRRAMRLDRVLLIVERLLPERIECCEAHREITMMDMHMLVVPGGRERTGVEYAELCASAGLELIQTKPTGSPFAIMQARKIDARTAATVTKTRSKPHEPRIYRPCRRRRPLSRRHRLRGRCGHEIRRRRERYRDPDRADDAL